MCGEYADMAIESGWNDYIDSRFSFDNDDDDDSCENCSTTIKSPYTNNSPKIGLIAKDNEYLLRNFKCNLNMVVKCIRVTDKAILFQCIDEYNTKAFNKLFWVAKSLIHTSNEPNQKSIFYIPDWTKISLK